MVEQQTRTQQQTITTETATSQYIEVSKAMRYQKQLSTLFGSAMDNLCKSIGLQDNTRKEVFSGNSADKKIVFGLVLANTQLQPKAKEEYTKALNKLTTATEEEE